jgi:hypothetical protein
MKVKNDFITNSSSTSFIINEKNTKEVAKRIVNIIFSEWESHGYGPDDIFRENIYNAIEKLSDNDNILIPFTCNYETFIYTYKGQIIVDTCWNHNWSSLNIIGNYRSECDEYNLEYNSMKDNLEFINIESGLIRTKDEHLRIIWKKYDDTFNTSMGKYKP